MSKHAAVPRPTDAELDILRILWSRGKSTVREVHGIISPRRDIGYTTVLKQMQVMHLKGLLNRHERFRAHVYAPAQSRSATQRALTKHLLEHAFEGSALRLLESAMGGLRLDAQEIADLRTVLDDVQKRRPQP